MDFMMTFAFFIVTLLIIIISILPILWIIGILIIKPLFWIKDKVLPEQIDYYVSGM